VPNALDLTVPLLAALVLGGAIGLERERQERAAGLRTVTMVALGSCLFTLLSAYGFEHTDPSRVAAQIVTGIGFLGAGTIFLRKDLVRGLTTAATIWATAAIGMAAATAQYFEAFFTTLLVLAVLMVLKPIERRIFKRPEEASISMMLPRSEGAVDQVTAVLRKIGAIPQSIHFLETQAGDDRVDMELEMPGSCTTRDLIRELRTVPGVHQISIARALREDRSRLGS